jgi:hypothetical protein
MPMRSEAARSLIKLVDEILNQPERYTNSDLKQLNSEIKELHRRKGEPPQPPPAIETPAYLREAELSEMTVTQLYHRLEDRITGLQVRMHNDYEAVIEKIVDLDEHVSHLEEQTKEYYQAVADQ